jgi:hypothetical protein
MPGYQQTRQLRRISQTNEASFKGLTAKEIARREETAIRNVCQDPVALQAAGFPLYGESAERQNCWAFLETFRFRTPPHLNPSKLIDLHLNKDLIWVLKCNLFYDSLDSMRAFRE